MFLLLGFTFMRAIVPGSHRFCKHDVWRALLGAGLGVGISSLAFLASLITGTPALAVEATVLAVLAWFAWRGTECRLCKATAQPWGALDGCVAVVFALAMMCAAVAFLRQAMATPHGHWDAWAIHNLHARFLYHSAAWRDLFSPVLTWSHPDYPLLIPGFVASWWKLLGNDSTVVPAATAFLFTFGAAGLLASSLTLLRDRRQGLLAGLVLLGAPYFIGVGAWQFADVPLAWFLLAATVLLAMDHGPAAGLAAGFAAWTKNDGVILFVAVVVGWGLARQWTFQRLRGFGLGALVPLAVLVWFKLTLAPPNPLVSTANAREHLMDASRHLTILTGFLQHLWSFGGLFASSFLFLVGYAVLMPSDKAHRGTAHAVALTLVLVACGDWAVYMFSTHGALADLIDSSLPRLLVQLWPTVVFLVFLTARAIERKPGRAPEATKSPSAEPTRILAPTTLVFSIVLSGIILNAACREGAPPKDVATAPLPVRDATQNLVPRQAGILAHFDLVGPTTPSSSGWLAGTASPSSDPLKDPSFCGIDRVART